MFLIALVMARVIGWKLSAAFCTYIGFGMLFVASQEGYLFQYFFRDDPSLFYVYTPFLTVGMAMSAILFARTLFETKTTFPEYDFVLKSYFYSGLAFSLVMLSLFSAREFVALVFLWMPLGAALRIGLGHQSKEAETGRGRSIPAGLGFPAPDHDIHRARASFSRISLSCRNA